MESSLQLLLELSLHATSTKGPYHFQCRSLSNQHSLANHTAFSSQEYKLHNATEIHNACTEVYMSVYSS